MSDLALRRLAPISLPARPVVAGALVIASLLLVALVAPGARAAAVMTVDDAESALMRGINHERAKVGLVALRADPSLGLIAGDRSADMAAGSYMSHTEPDGDTWIDYLENADVRWYSTSEALAWDRFPSLTYSVGISSSVDFTQKAWMASAPHRAMLLSTSYNYFGVGLAVSSNGTHYWTAIFIRGPDHTDPWVTPLAPVFGAPIDGVRMVGLTWQAADRRLQALTSGLRDVQLERRTDGGDWVSLGWTKAGLSLRQAVVGHRYDYRWRARDMAGNIGPWTDAVTISP